MDRWKREEESEKERERKLLVDHVTIIFYLGCKMAEINAKYNESRRLLFFYTATVAPCTSSSSVYPPVPLPLLPSKHPNTLRHQNRNHERLIPFRKRRCQGSLETSESHWCTERIFLNIKLELTGSMSFKGWQRRRRRWRWRWWAVQRQEWCLANLLMLAFNWSNLQFFSSASVLSQETNCEFCEVFFGNTVFSARLGLWREEETDARITVCLELPQRYKLFQNDIFRLRQD